CFVLRSCSFEEFQWYVSDLGYNLTEFWWLRIMGKRTLLCRMTADCRQRWGIFLFLRGHKVFIFGTTLSFDI
ncbi:hypothetical protein SDJN02_03015, partial [Cucurbita argyrosperma subsp. argyrosperma]